jgi:hypothetical protein
MRVARGACWVIIALLLAICLLAAIDALFEMPSWLRGVGLAAWLTGSGVLAWQLVAQRLPPDPTTSWRHARTELSHNLRAAAAAALALAGSLAAATTLPGAGEHFRRVAMPWYRTVVSPQYRVKVTSGEAVVRRGDSLTLSAYAEKLDRSAPTPNAAMLILRDASGLESRSAMSGDGNGVFHATLPAIADGFEYQIEIAGASSEWFSVMPVDAATPTAESRIDILPPRYAPRSQRRAVAGYGNVQGHQYATAEFHFHFSRPPATAFLEWRGNANTPLEVFPVALAPDRFAGAKARTRILCVSTSRWTRWRGRRRRASAKVSSTSSFNRPIL